MKRGLAVLVAGGLAACTVPQNGEVVRVPAYAPGSIASPLSQAARAIVTVDPFAELGPEAPPPVANPLFANGDAVVHFVPAPSPGQVLQQAVEAELRAAGEQIGGGSAPVVLNGAVQRFSAMASKAGLYWTVEANIAVAITARRGGRKLSHSYVSRCQDVAYTTPGAASMAPLIARCVANVAGQFRDDGQMARIIGG